MKRKLLVLPALAAVCASLTGCDFIDKIFGKGINTDDYDVVPEFSSGSSEEKIAILDAINNKSVCVNTTGNDLFPGNGNITFYGDDEDYVMISKKVIVDSYTVNITWDIDTTQATFDKRVTVDDYHDIIYIKYPEIGAADGTLKWSISKLECGSAVSTKANSEYTAKIVAPTIYYRPMTFDDIYANHSEDKTVTVGGTSYTYHSWNGNINYEAINKSNQYSPWWITGLPDDAADNYIYATIKGKVIFLSPDGNWGLVANGDKVVEIYSGNQLNLKESSFPDLKNKYVEIKCEVTHYYGNIQCSYITSIRAIDASEVTEPDMKYQNLTESVLKSIELSTGEYKQFSEEVIQNDLVSVTGTVVANSKAASGNRFTFDVMVGACKVTIAYDYHVDGSDKAVSNALNAAYNKGGSITIKGTYRFNHGQEKTIVKTDGSGGQLTIAPFEASQIA